MYEVFLPNRFDTRMDIANRYMDVIMQSLAKLLYRQTCGCPPRAAHRRLRDSVKTKTPLKRAAFGSIVKLTLSAASLGFGTPVVSAEDRTTIAQLIQSDFDGQENVRSASDLNLRPSQTLEPLPEPNSDVRLVRPNAKVNAVVGAEKANPNVSNQWLDIRPRNIESEQQELIATEELPQDDSELPVVNSIQHIYTAARSDFVLRDFMWSGTFCHRPLYFEDPYLERYGMATGCLHRVPAVQSAANISWKTTLLPVSLAFDPPWQKHASGFRQPYWMRAVNAVR
ncbi:hypothetical protein LOC67_23055 [Stieleria sp. JC731]|uniref:hypothetical protein n=1 Tax=Stieleria sp. JC731 TaxID=2894195 RepID=UPI001E573655|nr:hypothetical protein [Stieleria sp. JC731]MCC9603438.1 hypothetical protein [Stieleria sp. JC731]